MTWTRRGPQILHPTVVASQLEHCSPGPSCERLTGDGRNQQSPKTMGIPPFHSHGRKVFSSFDPSLTANSLLEQGHPPQSCNLRETIPCSVGKTFVDLDAGNTSHCTCKSGLSPTFIVKPMLDYSGEERAYQYLRNVATWLELGLQPVEPCVSFNELIQGVCVIEVFYFAMIFFFFFA